MASQSTKSKSVLKDPEGGLTAAGREHFKKAGGAHLKPGVKGDADTPEKMHRKGSFLVRHYGRKEPFPLLDAKNRPTRYALQAHAWGEPVPATIAAVKKLAVEGRKLLAQYEKSKRPTSEKPSRSSSVRRES